MHRIYNTSCGVRISEIYIGVPFFFFFFLKLEFFQEQDCWFRARLMWCCFFLFCFLNPPPPPLYPTPVGICTPGSWPHRCLCSFWILAKPRRQGKRGAWGEKEKIWICILKISLSLECWYYDMEMSANKPRHPAICFVDMMQTWKCLKQIHVGWHIGSSINN